MNILGASLYIMVCSARNRIRMRLRRLREPRYLVGAIVGAAYIYFSFFARLRASRVGQRRRLTGTAPPPILVLSAVRSTAPGAIGLALMAIATAGWILPWDSSLLSFSDAEVQFLFPAPVSRRALLLHRMIRSQLGLLFGGMIMGIAMPAVSGYGRLRVGIAMWLLLSIGKVYFTGVSLARSRLVTRDARARRVAWLPVSVLTAALAVVGKALFDTFAGQRVATFQDLLIRVGTVTSTGASRVVLWPFIAIARPFVAPWPGPYLVALLWSAVVLAVTVAWVLQSDAAFEDVAVEQARKPDASRAQMVTYRVRSAGLTLAPTGRPEIVFAWKAAMQTLRIFDRRVLLRVAAVVLALTVVASSMGRANGLATVLGSMAIAGAIFIVVMGPQALRVDMREDLRHLELLKTWPVPPPAVVRGELLWPGVALTALAWIAILAAEVLSPGTAIGRISVAWRLAIGCATAIVAPALLFAQLTIHNAAALIFPAWVPLGYQRPRGLDALGQRLITLSATWLVLLLSAVPGAIAAGIVWLAFGRFLGPAAVVPAAAVCAAIIAIEVLLATEALGPAYERLDVTAVERAE